MHKHKCYLGKNKEAVLYEKLPWYKRRICISTRNPYAHMYHRTDTAIIIAKQQHIRSDYYYIVHPLSAFRLRWELLMTITWFTYFVTVPLSVAYIHVTELTSQYGNFFSDIQLVLCLICMADIIMTFLTGYTIKHEKQIVMQPRAILEHYLYGYFWLDLVSSFPILPVEYLYKNYDLPVLWRICNLISLLKIFRIKTLINYATHISDHFRMNEDFTNSVIYLVLSLLVLHWVGCFQYIVPAYCHYTIPGHSWINYRKILNNSILLKYNECLFKAATLLFCVSNEVYSSKTFEDKVMDIVGGFVGYIVAGLSLVIFLDTLLRVSSSEIKYHSIMNQLSQYMRHKQLPLNMQRRLVDYYEYKYRGLYFRESTILPIISDKLRKDIAVYTCTMLMKTVPLLKDLPPATSTNIALACKPEVYLANDTIFKAGTPSDCMYFIECGSVAIFSPTGKEVCHLQDGAYFGEMGLMTKDQKRVANTVALETTELYKLERRQFNILIKEIPDLYKKMEAVGDRRRENTMVMEEIHRKHILEKTMRLLGDRT